MNKGDLIFRKFSTEEPINDLWYFLNLGIYKFTKSSYTHVGICIGKDDYGYDVAESTAKGFVITKWSIDDYDRRILSEKWEVLKVKGIKIKNLREYAEGLVGTPYGYFDYVKFITYYITGKKLFKESSERMVCSEAISILLFLCGIDIRNNKKDRFDYISPADVYNKVSSLY